MGIKGMGFAGDLVSGYLGQPGSGQEHDQARALARYRNAFNDYSNMSNTNEQGLEASLGNASASGYRAEDALAAALNSGQRRDAGVNASQQYGSHLDAALAGMQAGPSRSWTGTGKQFGKAQAGASAQLYDPAFQTRRAAMLQQATTQGQQDYDTRAFNTLGESQADIGRDAGYAQRRAQLMQGFLDQQLQQQALRFNYQGPTNAQQNTALAGKVGGTALMAFL